MESIRAPSHRLYLDESGDHRYDSLDDISRRYLTILGCIFQRDTDYEAASKRIVAIKQKYWPHQDPDKPIIFHREDMVRKRGFFSILNDPDTLKNFNVDLLNFLSTSNYTIINVTIDKKAHLARYKYPEHPYHYCIQVMLERYVFWLEEHSTLGDVMAESRGKEDLALKKVHRAIWEDGTIHKTDSSFFQKCLTSKEIKIKPKSSNIPGLQIADLLAYPLREKMLYERNIRPGNFVGKFSETVYKAVSDKIRKKSGGKVAGYGEIFLQ